MSNLSKSDSALLQARHAYNDAKIVKVVDGGGFTVGSDTVTIEMNRMSWGLFESTILKAFKDRQDLRDRNPELVEQDVECPKCKGAGNFPFTDEENYDKLLDWNKKLRQNMRFIAHQVQNSIDSAHLVKEAESY
jgi:hypothetical protein